MLVLRDLIRLKEEGLLRPVDYHFAKLLASYANTEPDAVALAGALVSSELSSGHVCIDLASLSERPRVLQNGAEWPSIDGKQLCAALAREPAVCGGPDSAAITPLVLERTRLYLQRYWQYETSLASRLSELAGYAEPVADNLRARLDVFFPPSPETSNRQKAAVAIALTRRLSIITGGPGTGKTTTVATLLVLLAEQAIAEGHSLIMNLAAPTGKAAARMNESLGVQLKKMQQQGLIDPAVRNMLPDTAYTLHRLLGARLDGTSFRHHEGNSLALDILVVDESSMIDLRMMVALLDALPRRARIVLLGDKDQLASVEAGNVFGELCLGAGEFSKERCQEIECLSGEQLRPGKRVTLMSDATGLLEYSYRFAGGSGIGRLAQAVKTRDITACQLILAKPPPDLVTINHGGMVNELLIETAVDGYRDYLEALQTGLTDRDILRRHGNFQVLCALREGAFGVSRLNFAIEAALIEAGLIRTDRVFYAGRPILITQNDHSLQIYNGDIGVILPDEEGKLAACFLQADGSVRRIAPSRLPEHETVYAMTVHKSQGSEFDHVLFILPDSNSRHAPSLVRRELIYTGITRAKHQVTLGLPRPHFEHTWLAVTQRISGLSDRLRPDAQP